MKKVCFDCYTIDELDDAAKEVAIEELATDPFYNQMVGDIIYEVVSGVFNKYGWRLHGLDFDSTHGTFDFGAEFQAGLATDAEVQELERKAKENGFFLDGKLSTSTNYYGAYNEDWEQDADLSAKFEKLIGKMIEEAKWTARKTEENMFSKETLMNFARENKILFLESGKFCP